MNCSNIFNVILKELSAKMIPFVVMECCIKRNYQSSRLCILKNYCRQPNLHKNFICIHQFDYCDTFKFSFFEFGASECSFSSA
jgi:hypothetical protein